MESNEIVRKEILKIVDNQLKGNDPPETKQTYERLQKAGYDKSDAKKLIAQCVAVEIFNVLKHNESFNEKRFLKNLKHLPKEPFDDE